MKHNGNSGVLEAFGRYTQAFQALDARAVARHFHEPAFFITPKDIVSLPTVEAVEQTYARVMADMPPDYVRTEFSPLSEHRLSDDLAMVSGSGVWKNAANEDEHRKELRARAQERPAVGPYCPSQVSCQPGSNPGSI